MARVRQEATPILNPILLWLLIHGGDPPPDKATLRMAAARAINVLAPNLSPAAQKTVQAAIAGELR